MITEPTLGAIRFGFGPAGGRRVNRQELLSGLTAPDLMRSKYPVPTTRDVFHLRRDQRETDKAIREERTPLHSRQALRERELGYLWTGMRAQYARLLATDRPFFERLTFFWSDHFTVADVKSPLRVAIPGYVDEAIRPQVTGRFADMLKAVVHHPAMLLYLDQNTSMGPNSTIGLKRKRGLNENLAREVLELHTLGVGGPYTQDDVRQLAELFTGLSFDDDGYLFRPGLAEPGQEIVLGKVYGSPLANPAGIDDVLEDLAMHPSTIRHLSRKLAVHFVSDDPDPELVDALADAYRQNDGALMPVYEALLAHPSSWSSELAKARQPRDYIGAMLIALGIAPETVMRMERDDLNRFFFVPLRAMGQPHQKPGGPDGWPEEADYWITPQGLASRISVATRISQRMAGDLPDPRIFLDQVLGDAAGPALRFAVSASENRAEAITLILASVEMNRR